ncbi:MAG TPA: citrate synthase [Clostridiales bacterium]|nr:citrate synthase [Clostridiales bacterium]HBE14554.1 citrate synthase [Clostridiales bacterium]
MSTKRNYAEIIPEVKRMADLCISDNVIEPSMYVLYNVYRGLRDINGKGVLTGLTEISEIQSKKKVKGKEVPCKGKLYYRGYHIQDLVNGFIREKRFGFEEITYLLLFGTLPSTEELTTFTSVLTGYRSLPNSFVRDLIMKAPSENMMNSMARSVLTMYSYDKNPDDTSIPNVLRQCLQLIATFPMMAVYGYQAYDYYIDGSRSFFMHEPEPELSTAENILHMLRIDSRYTKLEARILDLALVLHAEHGGGNNSTFTTRVVSSSGTDTYSAIAAALGSLKGPKHGGANIKVCQMFRDIKGNVKDWNDQEEIEAYLKKILHKEAFDRSGLIYGIGHAIYSLSDPRATILNRYVKKLSREKKMQNEYKLYAAVEKIAPKVIARERKMYKGVSANIDFYSGFVYDMLGLPMELYTPIFAIARIAGWSAHRLEELINAGKIIRPAYMNVHPRREYVPMDQRTMESR